MADNKNTSYPSLQLEKSVSSNSVSSPLNTGFQRFGGNAKEKTSRAITTAGKVSSGHIKSVSAQHITKTGKMMGRNMDKNARKKLNRKDKAVSDQTCATPRGVSSSTDCWRFQLRMVTGEFTEPLKCELIRILNNFLYSIPPGSFIPTFTGCGLRYGLVWFNPCNQESCTWLKQILEKISASGLDNCKFIIEPFDLYQNMITLFVPWDNEEELTIASVSARLLLLNPGLNINRWKFLGMKSYGGRRLLYWSIGNDSLDGLRTHKFQLNYGFEKLLVRVGGRK